MNNCQVYRTGKTSVKAHPGCEGWPSGRPSEAVFGHLAGEGVPVDAEQIGGFTQVAVGLEQHLHDELLLELPLRLVVADPSRHHLVHQLFELFTQRHQRTSFPVRRRNASRYLSRVRITTSSGSEGTGGCLFQLIFSR